MRCLVLSYLLSLSIKTFNLVSLLSWLYSLIFLSLCATWWQDIFFKFKSLDKGTYFSFFLNKVHLIADNGIFQPLITTFSVNILSFFFFAEFLNSWGTMSWPILYSSFSLFFLQVLLYILICSFSWQWNWSASLKINYGKEHKTTQFYATVFIIIYATLLKHNIHAIWG